MNFNHWDIILTIPIAYAAWKGFGKGLIIELASIAALIAGLYVAANFSDFVANALKEHLAPDSTWVGYLSFILTFVGVVFGVYALAKVLEKAVNMVALKLANKLAGLLFGTVKMILICSIVLNLLSWVDQYIPVLRKSSPQDSMLFEPILQTAPILLPILTDSDWMVRATDLTQPLFNDDDSAESMTEGSDDATIRPSNN